MYIKYGEHLSSKLLYLINIIFHTSMGVGLLKIIVPQAPNNNKCTRI